MCVLWPWWVKRSLWTISIRQSSFCFTRRPRGTFRMNSVNSLLRERGRGTMKKKSQTDQALWSASNPEWWFKAKKKKKKVTFDFNSFTEAGNSYPDASTLSSCYLYGGFCGSQPNALTAAISYSSSSWKIFLHLKAHRRLQSGGWVVICGKLWLKKEKWGSGIGLNCLSTEVLIKVPPSLLLLLCINNRWGREKKKKLRLSKASLDTLSVVPCSLALPQQRSGGRRLVLCHRIWNDSSLDVTSGHSWKRLLADSFQISKSLLSTLSHRLRCVWYLN